MNKLFFIFFYGGSLLISLLYGSSFLLPIYMKMLNGGEMNMGTFLIYMGIGALLSVVSLNKQLLRYFAPLSIIQIGTIAYSLGLLALGLVTHILHTYAVACIMGIGWGLIYSASIIALTTNATVTERKNHFSYFAAINALGAGLAPVLFHFINKYGISLKQIYLIEGSIISIIIIACFMIARSWEIKYHQNAFVLNDVSSNKFLFARQNIISLCTILMAFLSACIFSTLTFFQITFAEMNHVNYATFFSLITIAIILSRLILIHWVSEYKNMLIYLSLIMILSIILFLFIDLHPAIYVLSALLFGISYGLIFPLIQTISIAYAPVHLHNNIITYFISAYFIGIFGFPIVGASIMLYMNHAMIISVLIGISIVYTIITAVVLSALTKSIILSKKFKEEIV